MTLSTPQVFAWASSMNTFSPFVITSGIPIQLHDCQWRSPLRRCSGNAPESPEHRFMLSLVLKKSFFCPPILPYSRAGAISEHVYQTSDYWWRSDALSCSPVTIASHRKPPTPKIIAESDSFARKHGHRHSTCHHIGPSRRVPAVTPDPRAMYEHVCSMRDCW